MADFQLFSVRKQIGPADFADEGQSNEFFEFTEPLFRNGELELFAGETAVSAFGLEAEDELLFADRFTVRGEQDFSGADAHRGFGRHIALCHVQRQDQRQTEPAFRQVVFIVLRPSGDHPFALDFQRGRHQTISSS